MTISCSTTARAFTMRYKLPFVSKNAAEFQRDANKAGAAEHTHNQRCIFQGSILQ